MPQYQSPDIIGFHSCDMEVGLQLLNGVADILPSKNDWDWLGPGSYFWEQDPSRSLVYATENATGKQKNRKPAKIPFVIGAIIELSNCLNLVDSTSLETLSEAYEGLKSVTNKYGELLPVNKGSNRALDCAVIKYIHEIRKAQGKPLYDSIRCAFPEGEEAYPGAMITSRLHIQVCVCNPYCIKGYFLPRPIKKFNPHLPVFDMR
ncbi:hypothetical protein [Mucilaginibacter flavidus]|uniref:hypothetical protein n=1 Tax=Mucilaginibacter flavidus TaxID=2949309 RepID=UPI0020926DF8|nr:hypothetical protein [Mucilaginibacter flavidus]MCO5948936.1 hypothetical protein [Mucilaginibacter flavidus]